MIEEVKKIQVKAPNSFRNMPRPYIFLCGSIEMGKAENWQNELFARLEKGTVLNPRRDDWDSSWVQSVHNKKFREQVEWELKAQEEADVIAVHFDPSTKSPITLLELGLFKDKCIVHCPEGYWRKGNVDIVCGRYGIRMVNTIEELADTCQLFEPLKLTEQDIIPVPDTEEERNKLGWYKVKPDGSRLLPDEQIVKQWRSWAMTDCPDADTAEAIALERLKTICKMQLEYEAPLLKTQEQERVERIFRYLDDKAHTTDFIDHIRLNIDFLDYQALKEQELK